MPEPDPSQVVQCGREITDSELEQIESIVELFPGLALWELTRTLCEHLDWHTAAGGYKTDACSKLLRKLEDEGRIRLPSSRYRGQQRKGKAAPEWTVMTASRQEVKGSLADVSPVSLEVVIGREATGLWNEYVARYHYLGYKKPFGCPLRYFIRGEGDEVLGCLLLAGAAKALGQRDRWIDWSDRQRLRNLPWVVNNSRFLIFPWVRVKMLASHVLGLVRRQVVGDWYRRWGYRPVLLETFVDPERFRGTSYRASGWTYLGNTTGEGLRRPGRRYHTTPKMIFVQPLTKDFRARLVSENLQGRRTP